MGRLSRDSDGFALLFTKTSALYTGMRFQSPQVKQHLPGLQHLVQAYEARSTPECVIGISAPTNGYTVRIKGGILKIGDRTVKIDNYVPGKQFGCGFVNNGPNWSCYGQYDKAGSYSQALQGSVKAHGILDKTTNRLVSGDLSQAQVGAFPIFRMGAKFQNYFEVTLNKDGLKGLNAQMLATNIIAASKRDPSGHCTDRLSFHSLNHAVHSCMVYISRFLKKDEYTISGSQIYSFNKLLNKDGNNMYV